MLLEEIILSFARVYTTDFVESVEAMADYTNIPVEQDTKQRITAKLRGGERYDGLLSRMVETYEDVHDL